MKEYFKDKYNIAMLVMYGIGIICIPLIAVAEIFYLLFSLFMAVACIMSAIKSIKKYRNKISYDPRDEIFDASEYSYDEGQYYIGEGKPKSKIRGLGKMDVFLPSLLFICLSGIFCGMTIFGIIALF